MTMISALLVLFAVFVGVSSLSAFGYSAWEIVVILVPMAILVALFFTGVTYFGLWSVRRLNRAAEQKAEEQTGPQPAARGMGIDLD